VPIIGAQASLDGHRCCETY